MRKRLLYLGVLMFLAGMAVALMSVSSLQAISSSGASPTVGQLALNPGALRDVPVPLNQTSILVFSYNSSAEVDFYLANQSAFAAMDAAGANGTSARRIAAGLEGKGIYAIYENASLASFPYASGPVAPVYLSNASALPAGTYYAVFGSGGAATVVTSYTALGAAEFGSAAVSTLAYGGISTLLLAAGFLLAVVSFFMKEKNAGKPDALDEEARREYDLLEKRGGAGEAGKPRIARAAKKRLGQRSRVR
jgi:hypothetical protein